MLQFNPGCCVVLTIVRWTTQSARAAVRMKLAQARPHQVPHLQGRRRRPCFVATTYPTLLAGQILLLMLSRMLLEARFMGGTSQYGKRCFRRTLRSCGGKFGVSRQPNAVRLEFPMVMASQNEIYVFAFSWWRYTVLRGRQWLAWPLCIDWLVLSANAS